MEEKTIRNSKTTIIIEVMEEGQELRLRGKEEDTGREDVRERSKMNVIADLLPFRHLM